MGVTAIDVVRKAINLSGTLILCYDPIEFHSPLNIMTIALVAHYLGPKMGIGVYIDRLVPPLVQQLNDRGIDVKIISSPNAFNNTPALQKLESIVQILPALDDSPMKRYLWMCTHFSQYCSQEKIDTEKIDTVVWLSNPVILPWHPRSIAVIHDVNEWKAKDKYGSRLKTSLRSLIYLESSIRFADKIILVSKATEADLLHFRSGSRLWEKVKTIPNGVDSPLAGLIPALIDAPTTPFLLSVGRIDPVGKRLPEAVALVKALREQTQQPWELHLAGGMNATTQQAGEQFLQSIETIPWVHYQGYMDDRELAAWYQHATAVVFLSEHEGFGSPVAEAASFDRRVIVSKNNVATQESGGDAVIPIDPEELQSAAVKVLRELEAKEQRDRAPSTSLYTYAKAATTYTELIASMSGC
ncbi:glycosyltransferase [Leptolyngbya sp. AN03gr2]|uniref:glycosyltransferase n=1 Tax=unclassified Leptolyngbya TaxID=2650499 RepID=UPI003D313D5C